MDFKDLLLSANGRISRQPFWIATGILIGANIVLGLIPLVNMIGALVLLYCWICVYSKRLHDLGMSGFFQIAVWVISIVAAIAGMVMIIPAILAASGGPADERAMLGVLMSSGAALGLMGLSFLIWIVFHLWLGIAPGKTTDNRFGPSPLAAPQDAF